MHCDFVEVMVRMNPDVPHPERRQGGFLVVADARKQAIARASAGTQQTCGSP
jgi:hypothetical protein